LRRFNVRKYYPLQHLIKTGKPPALPGDIYSLPDELFRRLRHDKNRPLLQVADPLQRLRDLHTQRHPLYRQTAHISVETGRPSVSSLFNLIIVQIDQAGIYSGNTAMAA